MTGTPAPAPMSAERLALLREAAAREPQSFTELTTIRELLATLDARDAEIARLREDGASSANQIREAWRRLEHADAARVAAEARATAAESRARDAEAYVQRHTRALNDVATQRDKAFEEATAAEVRLAEAEKALERIAAFTDIQASQSLVRTGSYAAFDEPASVEIARAFLAKGGSDAG